MNSAHAAGTGTTRSGGHTTHSMAPPGGTTGGTTGGATSAPASGTTGGTAFGPKVAPASTGTGQRPSRRLAGSGLVWLGSALVVGSSVTHFYLWDSQGYSRIPTIGPLFLMQAIVGVVLAVVTSFTRHWLLALAEAGFALASAGGLVISVNFGLFGWQESMSAPYAGLALGIELAAGAVLLVAGALLGPPWPRHRR